MTAAFPLIRHFSRPLTHLLVRLPITPNQITTVSLILGVAGCLLLISPEFEAKLTGALLFFISYIFDNCDGEVARHKNLVSKFGENYDTCVDWIVNSGFFVALGYGVAQETSNDLWLWLGLAGGAGGTINYVITLFSTTENSESPTESAPPTKLKEYIIYIFRELFRADFCFIVLALIPFDAVWLLLPAGAIGAQIYWLLFLISPERSRDTSRSTPMIIFKALFLLIGLGLLVWIIKNTDLAGTLDLVSQIGFGFGLILGIYFLAFLVDSLTWQMTVLSAPLTPTWLYRFFQMRLAGEAFNNILPAASMGGEPIKAVLLKNLYGFTYLEGVASLILARTINTVALILFLIVGFTLMLGSAVLGDHYNDIAGIGLIVLSALILLFYAVQRFRITSLISEALSTKSGFRWLGGMLQHINDIDDKLVTFYTGHHARAMGALALAFINWVFGAGEIYLTLHFLGHPVSLVDAWIIEAVAQLVRAATFFIPASIGAQEGAFMIIGSAVTGSPTAGFATAIVRRAREIIWIIWGMAAFYIIKPEISSLKEDGPS